MTRNDVSRIVNAAKSLIAAHERRNPALDSTTLNERQAIEDLERVILETPGRGL